MGAAGEEMAVLEGATGIYRNKDGQNGVGQVQIVIDGMTASGKTTAVRFLAQELGLKVMPEEFRDQYDLLRRYTGNAKWCLPMQLNFLVTRYAQYLVASESHDYILDRSIYSDKVYADFYYQQGQLDGNAYEGYVTLHNHLMREIKPPRCILFLKCSLPVILERIRKRGRQDEIALGEEYWRNLYTAYERHIDEQMRRISQEHCLVVDTSRTDWIGCKADRDDLIRSLRGMLRERTAC